MSDIHPENAPFPIEEPYSPSRRPAKIVDAMWEMIGNYRRPDIAFNSLVDLMIMLVAKPVAITLLRKENKLYRHLISTMSDADVQSPFGPSEQILSDKVISKFHLLEVPPHPPNRPSTLFAVLSAVSEPTPAGRMRGGAPVEDEGKPFELKPYAKREHLDPFGRPPKGLDYDLWCIARLFEELRSGSQGEHDASLKVLASIHAAASLRRPGHMRTEDVGPMPWHIEEFKAWNELRESVAEKYWRRLLSGAFPEIEGRSPQHRMADALEFVAVFRCALPDGAVRAGAYDYTAQVVLSSEQSRAARNFLSKEEFSDSVVLSKAEKKQKYREFRADPREVLKAIELPLSRSYRSIADTPFQSGFADFAREGFMNDPLRTRAPAGNPDDEEIAHDANRKRAEELLFSERGEQSLYVPVHVGGVPWVNLLILHTDEMAEAVSNSIWERRYQAYRGQVAIIAARLRSASKLAYMTALGDAFRLVLAQGERRDWLATVNKKWRQLSAFFPHEVVELNAVRASSVGDDRVEMPWSETVEIVMRPNPHPCFRRDRLPFDALEPEPLLTHLRSVVTAAVAERWKPLSVQEGAFAHDVKHWTNPIRDDIRRAENALPRESEVREHLGRARLHLNILNACADARNQAMRNRHRKIGRVEKSWMLEPPEQTIAVAAAFELLLHLHAKTIRGQRSDDGEMNLEWKGRWANPTEIFEELHALLAPDGRTDPEETISRPPVLWPLGMLREVVHNIRIKKPVAHPECRTISIDYSVSAREGGVELLVTQRSVDRQTFPAELQEGIDLANGLYGARGAAKGLIGVPRIEHEAIKVELSDGQVVDAFRIEYELPIVFNH